MVASVQNTIRIDQNWLDANKNEKADMSFVGRFQEYSSKAIGAFRSLQVIKSLSALRNEVGTTPSPIATQLQSTTGTAMTALGIIRLPSATQDAVRSMHDISQNDGVSTERKVGKAIVDTMDAISAWVYTAIFLTGKTTLLGVAKFADVAGDAADLSLSASDLNKSIKCEEAATGDVKKAFTHTKKYNMLRVAKAVVSIASAILAAVMFLTGAMILPTVAMIIISLSTALIAIRRDLHKEEGAHRVIEFKHSVLV